MTMGSLTRMQTFDDCCGINDVTEANATDEILIQIGNFQSSDVVHFRAGTIGSVDT